MSDMSRGRPKKKYSEDQAIQVQALSQYGVPQEDIAAHIGLCVETMLALYDQEYRKGKAVANAKVGKRLFEKCESGDTTALIFWAKTQMGWKETQKVDHTSSDGTMTPSPVISLDGLSDEMVERLEKAAYGRRQKHEA